MQHFVYDNEVQRLKKAQLMFKKSEPCTLDCQRAVNHINNSLAVIRKRIRIFLIKHPRAENYDPIKK